jgi:hypothetical protein
MFVSTKKGKRYVVFLRLRGIAKKRLRYFSIFSGDLLGQNFILVRYMTTRGVAKVVGKALENSLSKVMESGESSLIKGIAIAQEAIRQSESLTKEQKEEVISNINERAQEYLQVGEEDWVDEKNWGTEKNKEGGSFDKKVEQEDSGSTDSSKISTGGAMAVGGGFIGWVFQEEIGEARTKIKESVKNSFSEARNSEGEESSQEDIWEKSEVDA